jgi:hypothetical protein
MMVKMRESCLAQGVKGNLSQLIEEEGYDGGEEDKAESDAESTGGKLRLFWATRRERGGFLVEQGERVLRVGRSEEGSDGGCGRWTE